MVSTSAVTYAKKCSKSIEDYCNISFCRRRNREYNINSNNAINDSNNIAADNDNSDSHDSNGNGYHETYSYFWNEFPGIVFDKNLTDAYEKVIHQKQNLLMMPKGAAGKSNIK